MKENILRRFFARSNRKFNPTSRHFTFKGKIISANTEVATQKLYMMQIYPQKKQANIP